MQHEIRCGPNTQTCAVCTGTPGTLPVMNQEAYRLSVKAALGLNCQIAHFTKWDRKSYYYPDLPKGYQISQYGPAAQLRRLPRHPRSGKRKPDSTDRNHPRPPRRRRRQEHARRGGGQGRQPHRPEPNRHTTSGNCQRARYALAAEAKNYLTELKLILNYLNVSDLQHAGGEPASRCKHQPSYQHSRRKSGHADRGSQEHEQLSSCRTCLDL